MLNALNIVKGAVSTKDLVPVLTHVAVHKQRLHAFNGQLHISAPCPVDKALSFTVELDKFLAAVRQGEEPTFEHAEQTLVVRQGKFRATLPAGRVEDFPLEPLVAKDKVKLPPGLLHVLRTLRPFMGTDAQRMWSTSILIKGKYAYASNNVIVVRATLPVSLPTAALPCDMVEELLRLDTEPQAMALLDTTVGIWLPDGVWLRSVLVPADTWPDMDKLLKELHAGARYAKVPPSVAQAVEQVQPFCPDPKHPIVLLTGTDVSTLAGAVSATVADLEVQFGQCAFHATPLLLALGAAHAADWSKFPRVPFKGEGLVGVVVGVTV